MLTPFLIKSAFKAGPTSHLVAFLRGEKQRVAIARALCNDPDIIFADEPTGNLDKHTSETIQTLLLGFAKERSKSLIIVTHDQDLANRCDHRYRLRDGLLELS